MWVEIAKYKKSSIESIGSCAENTSRSIKGASDLVNTVSPLDVTQVVRGGPGVGS